MKLSKSKFGSFEDQDIFLYELSNSNGMVVKIMNYGATITSIQVPGSDGKPVTINCGFDKFEAYFAKEYLENAPYFGCTVGRYCSQIKDSAFTMDGVIYKLADNCGANNLHGGTIGFDKKVWAGEELKTNDGVGVKFSLLSKDMEEGFPGNVEASVSFILNENNEILISYDAVPDKDTPLSMTNHTYFNLNGFQDDITGHLVNVFTSKKLALDDTGAATGVIVDVENDVDDLRAGKIVGDVHEQLGAGFEHFWVFDEYGKEWIPVAEVTDPESGRVLQVESTEPCMLFYSGMYTSDELKRENGDAFGKYRAFCCETHRYPNGPNLEGSPGSITKANEPFRSQTLFRIIF